MIGGDFDQRRQRPAPCQGQVHSSVRFPRWSRKPELTASSSIWTRTATARSMQARHPVAR
jgi:hypothetical protein